MSHVGFKKQCRISVASFLQCPMSKIRQGSVSYHFIFTPHVACHSALCRMVNLRNPIVALSISGVKGHYCYMIVRIISLEWGPQPPAEMVIRPGHTLQYYTPPMGRSTGPAMLQNRMLCSVMQCPTYWESCSQCWDRSAIYCPISKWFVA